MRQSENESKTPHLRAREDVWWRPRVLVAEPDATARRELVEGLCAEGYEAFGVVSGFDLFDRLSMTLVEFEPIEFDLILSAHLMRGWSGAEVLRGLRRSDWATPFVLFADCPDGSLRRGVRRLGGVVFERPIETAEVIGYARCLVPPRALTVGELNQVLGHELDGLDEQLAVETFDAEWVWSAIEEQLRREGWVGGSRPSRADVPV